MGGPWVRTCCFCNQPIWKLGGEEGRGIKVGVCPNDGIVFWVHPECKEAYQRRQKKWQEEGIWEDHLGRIVVVRGRSVMEEVQNSPNWSLKNRGLATKVIE